MRDIVGGAGTYSALGARLLSPPPRSRSVGWIVDKGSDFPPALEELIASWQTSVLLRPTPERLTTRGWNGYDQHQNRAFRYTTPKKRLTAEDLTPSLLAAGPSTSSARRSGAARSCRRLRRGGTA